MERVQVAGPHVTAEGLIELLCFALLVGTALGLFAAVIT
jgi:hypothetical protein